jgi:hypothetical protein
VSTPNVYTPARKIGPVTATTATGGAVGAALAQILVHLVPELQPVEGALTILIGAILAVASGYLVKPDPVAELEVEIPTGDGEHRADDRTGS